MPKITVRVPHQIDPAAAFAKVQPALEKTVKDFQGYDLVLDGSDTASGFTFKSMAFTIKGRVEALPGEVVVEIDLPFAAMMFKDKVERAITKNVTRALEGPPTAG
jgi:Putative polyhydroxyalkanoic acid system protein (PHA_gran_rgn)